MKKTKQAPKINMSKTLESAYSNFAFIGPSPIDFDTPKVYNTCVWDELCKFDLAKYIKRGKRKIGNIFNVDPHYKEGSHWTALYIDIHKQYIFYFNSTGEKVLPPIKKFIKRVIKQGRTLTRLIKSLHVSSRNKKDKIGQGWG